MVGERRSGASGRELAVAKGHLGFSMDLAIQHAALVGKKVLVHVQGRELKVTCETRLELWWYSGSRDGLWKLDGMLQFLVLNLGLCK
jgi:hypothetical protein